MGSWSVQTPGLDLSPSSGPGPGGTRHLVLALIQKSGPDLSPGPGDVGAAELTGKSFVAISSAWMRPLPVT